MAGAARPLESIVHLSDDPIARLPVMAA